MGNTVGIAATTDGHGYGALVGGLLQESGLAHLGRLGTEGAMARVYDNGTVRRFVPWALPLLLWLWLCSGCGTADPPGDSPSDRQAGWIDSTRIANSQREPHNWFLAGGASHEQYYSALEHIHAGNVAGLGFAWEYNPKAGRVLSRRRNRQGAVALRPES